MASGEPVDYDKLEEFLRALAYSSRLELLSLLRSPRALQDIRIAPRQVKAGETGDRAVARQTVQAHLDKLVEVGVVVARDREEGRGKEYVVSPQRMYQVLEEFRKVVTVTTGAPVPRLDTVDLGASKPAKMEEGPKLLLVHGLHEGKVFPLRRTDLRDDGRGWVIGRKAGLHVSLDYDPYISVENSEIVARDGAHSLMDLRSSKNGTWLNWRRLDKDERVPLTPGDVIGVGRSTLVFRRA
jgi:DNA-binding transcriptional ArsR family regulator